MIFLFYVCNGFVRKSLIDICILYLYFKLLLVRNNICIIFYSQTANRVTAAYTMNSGSNLIHSNNFFAPIKTNFIILRIKFIILDFNFIIFLNYFSL